ncbi:conserved hypothetical protein [Mesorhizobium albiziae]|uniref:Urease-associated protein n=1 Tax=Neomesorhizobium albiziae TaxID=335020 RepID=A0A1I4DBF5_9HYPH|nr:TIGR02117 family protein [Mesorhizobium albiziae]GLS32334.1 hypothetical protein GCM10007937_40440 [Mesorhizobium albiziae]SFK90958.1 conserved hypothetical protein [Mesorhizobium albiziae]
MRRFLRGLFALVLIVVLAFVLGTMVPRPLFHATAQAVEPRKILVLTNPIHTDIAIPVDAAMLERFAFLAEAGLPADHPEARWLVFGWGSRAFYIETPTWSDLKPGPVLSALTLDNSVMHVAISGAIDEKDPAVRSFGIGEAEFGRLVGFIEATFARESGGPIFIPGKGYGPNDGFFEANGSFTALLGCNTWTARGLREAGLRTGWWNPLPATLALSLGLHN